MSPRAQARFWYEAGLEAGHPGKDNSPPATCPSDFIEDWYRGVDEALHGIPHSVMVAELEGRF